MEHKCSGDFGPFYIVLSDNIYKNVAFTTSFSCVPKGIDSDDHLIYLVPNDKKDSLIFELNARLKNEENETIKNNISNALNKIFSFRDLINFAKQRGWPILNSEILENFLKESRVNISPVPDEVLEKISPDKNSPDVTVPTQD